MCTYEWLGRCIKECGACGVSLGRALGYGYSGEGGDEMPEQHVVHAHTRLRCVVRVDQRTSGHVAMTLTTARRATRAQGACRGLSAGHHTSALPPCLRPRELEDRAQ